MWSVNSSRERPLSVGLCDLNFFFVQWSILLWHSSNKSLSDECYNKTARRRTDQVYSEGESWITRGVFSFFLQIIIGFMPSDDHDRWQWQWGCHMSLIWNALRCKIIVTLGESACVLSGSNIVIELARFLISFHWEKHEVIVRVKRRYADDSACEKLRLSFPADFQFRNPCPLELAILPLVLYPT